SRADSDLQLHCLTGSALDSLFFFFFQAEDGIRDLIVTGVQTCALPIWKNGENRFDGRRNATCTVEPDRAHERKHRSKSFVRTIRFDRASGPHSGPTRRTVSMFSLPFSRSEERRVGKECRTRLSKYYYKT